MFKFPFENILNFYLFGLFKTQLNAVVQGVVQTIRVVAATVVVITTLFLL